MSISVSEWRQAVQDEIHQTVETALTLADSLLNTSKYGIRSCTALSHLTSIDVPLSARLTFIPEPTCNSFDFSLCYLKYDVNHALLMHYGILDALFGSSTGPKVLTYLNAYACLPAPAHTADMIARVEAVQALLDGFKATKDAIMARASHTPEGKLNRCAILLAYQRLLFYRARAQGHSYAAMEDEMRTAKTFLGMEQEFDAERVAVEVLEQMEGEIERAEEVERYARNVKQSAVWFEVELSFQRKVEKELESRARRSGGSRK